MLGLSKAIWTAPVASPSASKINPGPEYRQNPSSSTSLPEGIPAEAATSDLRICLCCDAASIQYDAIPSMTRQFAAHTSPIRTLKQRTRQSSDRTGAQASAASATSTHAAPGAAPIVTRLSSPADVNANVSGGTAMK